MSTSYTGNMKVWNLALTIKISFKQHSATHAKISLVVASLPKRRQQVMFALLVQVVNKYLTSLIMPSSLLQVVNSLFQTCWQLGTGNANTTCWRFAGRLATRCVIFACVDGLLYLTIIEFSFRIISSIIIWLCRILDSDWSTCGP
jgi:hypothetical protein